MTDNNRRLLLLSASRFHDTPYLQHARPLINHFLNPLRNVKHSGLTFVFIAYAGVSLPSFDAYVSKVRKGLGTTVIGEQDKLIGVHSGTPVQVLESADVIMVGGGNTFNLLNELYKNELIEAIRRKVSNGVPYIGWSAGTNIAGLTIKTTNDMPIVEPPSFDALKLVPLQINPHFISGKPPGHNGESREERLAEFLIVNPNVKVVAIKEGTGLSIEGDEVTLVGESGLEGLLFAAIREPSAIPLNVMLSMKDLES